MLITTERPTVLGIAWRAWSSLFRAAGRMLPLFIIAYLLMAGLDLAADRLSHILAIPSVDSLKEIVKDSKRLPWPGVSMAIARDVAVSLLRAIITAPLAVAMHRFILLDETRHFYFLSRLTLKFAIWLVALQVPVIVLAWLILFAGSATGLVPLLVVLLIALGLLLMQTSQLFPAVAVQEPSTDLSARLETALERGEGMFWLTLVALILTFLPLALVQAVVVRVSAKLALRAPLIVPIGKATAGFLAVLLISAAVSWLYSYGAHKPKTASQGAQLGDTPPA
jgi:hypothetical protein